MGDASETTEQRLLERYRYAPAQLSCDIFKVAHHGASNASSAAFLKTVDPQYAVISCGAGNFYGHPHGETLERLTLAGAEIYRTDRSGELVFLSDGYKFWTEKSSYNSFR
jgi:beta-lactamase superfamily II metal-dependent hydrolase